MKYTKANKRADLLKEWLMSTFSNDEYYYLSTLSWGIPDGDDFETVIEDLQEGFYDDEIDNLLVAYIKTRKRYEESGFYYNGNVYHNGLDCIDAAGYSLPVKITKTKIIYK